MTLIDRYVFREWLKVFAMGLSSMVGLIVVIQMFADIKDFREWGTPTSDVAAYFLWLIPGQMPIVLPVALLVSLLFTLGNMHKNQEIAAMRAAGLSLWRITRGYWFAGIAGTAVLLAVNTLVVPLSLERTRTIRETQEFQYRRKMNASSKASAGEASHVVFDNGRDGHRWRITTLGASTGQADGVQVFDLDAAGRPLRQTFAAHARYDRSKGCWIFENGRTFKYLADNGDTAPQEEFRSREFPAYTEDPLYMRLMAKKPTQLSFEEIDTLISLSGTMESTRIAALAVRWHSILAWPFSCMVVIALAIPFAVSGVRTNPMVGVSKAIGVFALYYLFDRIGFALGAQQILPAMLAAWIPNLAALAYAIPLCAKAN